MKTLHYSIIVILATSLVVSNNHVFADNIVTSYGGLVGWHQTDFKSDHGNYPIWYTITNGTVINTPLDLPSKTLFFMIKAPYDGQLIVQLPRSVIDSKNQGIDQPYFVEVRGTTGLSKINVTETSDEYIRTLKINFTKYASEIEIVGTFLVENHQPMIKNPSKLSSPLKQFKSGIAANDVKCVQGLQFVIRAEDGSPACVKPTSIERLLRQGWVNAYDNNEKYIPIVTPDAIKVQNTNFTINYDIERNGKILEANADVNSKSLTLSLKTTGNGTLIVVIPRALIDAKIGEQDEHFFVLMDGQEIDFTEIKKTIMERTLNIPFKQGIEKIEIIGTNPI